MRSWFKTSISTGILLLFPSSALVLGQVYPAVTASPLYAYHTARVEKSAVQPTRNRYMKISNGSSTSSTSVEILNEPPTLDAIDAVTMAEDAGTQTITLTGISAGALGEIQILSLDVSADNPDLFETLSVAYTQGLSTATLTIKPAANAFGATPITVTVDDGAAENNIATQEFTCTITPVNDPPAFDLIGDVLIDEDEPLYSIAVENISSGALEDQTVSFEIISSNESLIPTPDMVYDGTSLSGLLSFQPLANRNGEADITVRAIDSGDGDNTYEDTFTITVEGMNDAPTLDEIGDVSVNEDAGAQIIPLTGITAGPEETQVLTVTVSIDDESLFEDFSVDYTSDEQTGTLTLVPAANASGTASIMVTVQDDGPDTGLQENSITRTFSFNIIQTNDPPDFDDLDPVTIQEDSGEKVVTVMNITPGVGEEESQTVTISATSSNTAVIPDPVVNYTAATGQATLTFQPQANRFGDVVMTVTAQDSGGEITTKDFTVTVENINDAPTLDVINPVTVDEDAPLQIITLTGLSAGPFEDERQQVTVTHTTNKPELFTTLTVDYVAPGNTATVNFQPAPNVSGTATVTITLEDNGSAALPHQAKTSQSFTITITPVNDAPVITGQAPLSVNEDQAIGILLSHVTFTDSDNTSGFTLNVLSGSHFTVSAGNVVTPEADYYGTLSVPVTVSDGAKASDPFDLQITITPINDAPEIIGQQPMATGEAEPVEITLDQLTVRDPDNTYPDDFTLTVLSGTHYVVSGHVVTPSADFNGVLSVQVYVTDFSSNSDTYELHILVNSVNDAPVITSQSVPVSVAEDNAVTLSIDQLTIDDPDNTYPDDFVLTVLSGDNYSFTGNTITPALNFNGTLKVAVSVSDGLSNSAPYDMEVTVSPVNDVPVITGQNALSTDEDVSITLSLSNLIVTDPDNTFPNDFTLFASSGENYTVANQTITPAADFSGVLTVPVRVNDGAAYSDFFSLTIQVNASNDVPVITGQSPSPVEVLEDEAFTINFNNLVVADPDNTYPDDFSITLQSGSHYTYSNQTITPEANYTGTLSVGVRVNDGAQSSDVFSFGIVVVGENDVPVITGQKSLSVAEDNAITLSITDLVVSDPDNTFPNDFSLTVLTGENYTLEGATVHPADNFFGTLTVPVQVNDGIDISAPYSLSIQVSSVNDQPSFDPLSNMILDENAPQQTITITNISPGPLETQSFGVRAKSGNLALIPDPEVSHSSPNTTATITFTPNTNQTGTAIITVSVIDNDLSEFSRTFTVQVMDINGAPTLNDITYGPIQEDAALQSIPLAGITAGPNESQVLTVSASSDKPDLFETFEVVYQSPATTGTLRVKPKANQFGTTAITVRVQDDGSNEVPNTNFVEKQFQLVIHAVNDLPVFTSTPVEAAVPGELYQYTMTATDVDEGDAITFVAVTKPAWLTLSQSTSGQGVLKGTPPATASGPVTVKLQAKDKAGAVASQNYTILVNAHPTVSDFSVETSEDVSVVPGAINFETAFSDADGQTLQAIMLAELPRHGSVLLGGTALTVGAEVSATNLDNMQYVPEENFNGKDTIRWQASDGIVFSIGSAYVLITVEAVNDPPVISQLEDTAMEYGIGEGPRRASTEFVAVDVDNETLRGAEIGFRRLNFVSGQDMLAFEDTDQIKGVYDVQSGILSLEGEASLVAYNSAIRSITYENLSDVFSGEEIVKTLFYTVSDGDALSVTRDREIKLVDNFVDLTIPNGFTPNNDQVNDTWIISNIDRYPEASIRVFNMMGQEIYSSRGNYQGWDGTYKGKLLPIDTYYYTINLNLPYRKKEYKGSVLIIR